MLNALKAAWNWRMERLKDESSPHVSTDEVYGSLEERRVFL